MRRRTLLGALLTLWIPASLAAPRPRVETAAGSLASANPAETAARPEAFPEEDSEALLHAIEAYDQKRFKEALDLFTTLRAGTTHPRVRDWCSLYLADLLNRRRAGFLLNAKATEYLEEASANGLGQATYQLAMQLWRGDGVERDSDKAVELLQAASQQGFGLAAYQLAEFIREGVADSTDYLDVPRLYQQALTNIAPPVGPERANILFAWGMMVSKGRAGPIDGPGAVKLLTLADELGHPMAGYRVWHMYTFGEAVEKDFEAANDWYRRLMPQEGESEALTPRQRLLKTEHVDRTDPDFLVTMEQRAEEGDFRAARELGMAYEDGQLVEANLLTAAKWYLQAGQQGDLHSVWRLAEILFHASPRLEDREAANDWYRMAAKAGHEPSMFQLGKNFFQGNGVERDFQKAYLLFANAVGKGDLRALRYLATMHTQGMGVQRDIDRANELHLRMALLGDTASRFQSGVWLIQQGNPVQWMQGMDNLEKAAKDRHVPSMLAYGLQRVRSLPRPPPDAPDSEGYQWLLAAQAEGHPDALHSFGRLALMGYRPLGFRRHLALLDAMAAGGEPDWAWLRGEWSWYRNDPGQRRVALPLIQAAARSGVVEAQYFLARRHFEAAPELANPSLEQGKEWLAKAADGEHPEACAEMGYAALTGALDTRIDPERAEYWLRRAVQADSIRGKFLLGYAYRYGLGLDKNQNLAGRWLREAASFGHDAAQFEFGEWLEEQADADPVNRTDYLEGAQFWFRRAHAQGFPGAEQAGARVTGKLPPEEPSEPENAATGDDEEALASEEPAP